MAVAVLHSSAAKRADILPDHQQESTMSLRLLRSAHARPSALLGTLSLCVAGCMTSGMLVLTRLIAG
jgi:hypothetical protein